MAEIGGVSEGALDTGGLPVKPATPATRVARELGSKHSVTPVEARMTERPTSVRLLRLLSITNLADRTVAFDS
jgi:hypothetical protein